jgi:NIMA (never in mitosis gene a)-related kinase
MISKHKAAKKIIDESVIWLVAYQTLKGLTALHEMNILHRDIKCANIFLTKDQGHVKLADMNVSIVTANGMARTQTGTPYYASPEVWQEKPYSAKCDIWSLGCVLYEMAALRPPFVSHDLKSLKRSIISGVYKRIPIQYSNDLENFIRLCLRVDPRDRMNASELLENELIKKRHLLKEQLVNDSVTLNSSGSYSRKLIGKINLPKRRDFRNIKEMLPKHRFGESVDKITENKSTTFEEKNKENVLNFVNTGKVTRKDQLPNIKRCSSLNSKQEVKLKVDEKTLHHEDRPPLPKKPIRA